MSSSPAPSGTLTQGLDALLHTAAFAPISNLGWIRVTGSDRVRWLNGMVTNNIAALKPGEGNYNFFLNAQGRIQGDCTAFLQEDSILLETALDRIPALMTMLDHFIIMDDVELSLVELTGLLISGPNALPIVAALGTANALAAACSSSAAPPPFDPTAASDLKQTTYGASSVLLIRASSPIAPRIELWSDPTTIAAITNELGAPGLASETWAGPPQASPEDLEHLRVLSGIPLYGTDIRNSDKVKDLPQETSQDKRALNFAKGCYLGQEIVERIRSRGAVHRTFTGFLLEGDQPEPGAALTSEEKPVGELTSIARIGDRILALGYIRREVLTRTSSIQYQGGIATPSEVPFPL